MVPNKEGFLYPEMNNLFCNDCGLCRLVCPELKACDSSSSVTPNVYACGNKDEAIRLQSTSGGVFSARAQIVLDQHGVVFGAAFDETMKVKHTAVCDNMDLGKLRGSKYVQSDIGTTYKDAKKYLQQGKTVLFSGTPCQVVALKSFLGKDNNRLFTCDLLCKEVPSPGLFANYVDYVQSNYNNRLMSINFRAKTYGWGMTSTLALFCDGKQVRLRNLNNSFMYGFGHGITIRPSCYRCSYTKVHRYGDITLGDFWGIGNSIPFHHSTQKGISLILVNSQKGQRLINECSQQIRYELRLLEEAKNGQGTSLSHPLSEPKNREQFFIDYKRLKYKKLAKKYLIDKGLRGLIKLVIPQKYVLKLQKTRVKKIASLLSKLPNKAV